nr:MAG TPA: hypothetical protein [Caudoviricetes sp.]
MSSADGFFRCVAFFCATDFAFPPSGERGLT